MSNKEITDKAREAIEKARKRLEKEEQEGKDSLTEEVIAILENNKGAN